MPHFAGRGGTVCLDSCSFADVPLLSHLNMND
jgi:hypothetical protein